MSLAFNANIGLGANMTKFLCIYLEWQLYLWKSMLFSSHHSLFGGIQYILFQNISEYSWHFNQLSTPPSLVGFYVLWGNSLGVGSICCSALWIKPPIISVKVFERCRWKLLPKCKALILYSWKWLFSPSFAVTSKSWDVIAIGTLELHASPKSFSTYRAKCKWTHSEPLKNVNETLLYKVKANESIRKLINKECLVFGVSWRKRKG